MDDGKRMMKIIFKAGGCLTSLFGGLIVVIALIVGIIALAVSGSSSAEISDPTNDVYVLGLQQVQSEQHIANTINISVIKKACLVSGNNMTDKDTVATFIKKYFVKEAKATVPTQAQTTVPATTTKTYQFVTDEEIKEIFSKNPFSLSYGCARNFAWRFFGFSLHLCRFANIFLMRFVGFLFRFFRFALGGFGTVFSTFYVYEMFGHLFFAQF